MALKAKSLLGYKHIRFIGAGGIGMSAMLNVIEEQKKLGQLSKDLKVSKYDKAWHVSDPLADDVDLVVVSTAIPEDDPELSVLKKRSVEIWHRREMLFALSQSQGQKSIVISGTHGKTSCSGMLAHVMMHAGADPSFVVGGIVQDYQTNGHAGRGEYFVFEGDESDKSFLATKPEIALVVNVEADHLENYPGGLDEIIDCFSKFCNSAKKIIFCLDSPNAKAILERVSGREILTYSVRDKNADLFLDKNHNLIFQGKDQGKIELKMFGEYNFQNALGVLGAAHLAGISLSETLRALKNYHGIKRRLEFISCFNSITVFDDYAHHPTEVKALLDAALNEVKHEKYKRLVFVYQPHHPRRTQDFWNEFVDVFRNFPAGNLAFIADIYLARSGPIAGITSERMIEEINNPNVRYLKFADAKFDSHNDDEYLRLKNLITKQLCPGDLLLLVGAGNITKVADAFRP